MNIDIKKEIKVVISNLKILKKENLNKIYLEITDGENIYTVNLESAEKIKNDTENKSNFYGTGFDIHQLINGEKLRIGGIDISVPLSLQGHSDRQHVFDYRFFRVQAGSWRVEKYSKPWIHTV